MCTWSPRILQFHAHLDCWWIWTFQISSTPCEMNYNGGFKSHQLSCSEVIDRAFNLLITWFIWWYWRLVVSLPTTCLFFQLKHKGNISLSSSKHLKEQLSENIEHPIHLILSKGWNTWVHPISNEQNLRNIWGYWTFDWTNREMENLVIN